MVIKIKESADEQALSHSDRINDMLGTVEEAIAAIKNSKDLYGADMFVLKLINCRNGIDDLINDLAFTNA